MTILSTHHPDDQRQSTKQGRFYHIDGRELLSVTSILSAGVPKPALTYWASKSVAEFVEKEPDKIKAWRESMDTDQFVKTLKGVPWDYRDKAADRGSEVHDLIEQQTLTPEGSIDSDNPYFAQWRNWVETMKPHSLRYKAAEAVVYSDEYGYAGQLDAIIDLWLPDWDLPASVLLDYKTGKGVYPEAVLQLNAYAKAKWLSLDNNEKVPMPPVNKAMVLHLQEHRWRLVPIPLGTQYFDRFLAAMRVAAWVNDEARPSIKKPLMIGAAE